MEQEFFVSAQTPIEVKLLRYNIFSTGPLYPYKLIPWAQQDPMVFPAKEFNLQIFGFVKGQKHYSVG
jgi:hypothetical protein